MSVKMDMKALERVTAQLQGANVDESSPYAVAAVMSCTDATYDLLMAGPAQFTEAQCCVVAWCRLFRCQERPVDGADVAFAMSAFSIPTLDSALQALDSFECPAEGCEHVYQVLCAVIGLSPRRASVTLLAAERMRRACADALACDVEPCDE